MKVKDLIAILSGFKQEDDIKIFCVPDGKFVDINVTLAMGSWIPFIIPSDNNSFLELHKYGEKGSFKNT